MNNLPKSIRTEKVQKKSFGPKKIMWDDKPAYMTVTIQYDDSLKNGHNTFSITGDIRRTKKGTLQAFGIMSEEIEEFFPEFKKYLKWHLVASDGPMYYIANTLYHASDKDFNGLRAGEKKVIGYEWVCQEDGLSCTKIKAPYELEQHKVFISSPIFRIGKGKIRDLEAARRNAVWPEATDEELMADDLEDRLKERLPVLMMRFKAAVEELGFIY